MNFQIAHAVITNLEEFGVEHYVICPGGRNAPLVEYLTKVMSQRDERVVTHFEERSAAFFALGMSLRLKRPVAVVVTSGTAVANVLPAVIEAHYRGVQLVVVSADRPRSYRGSGAPQAVEQVGMFSHYANTYDIEQASEVADSLNSIRRKLKTGPLHFNICFDEPLLSGFDGMSSSKKYSQNQNTATPVLSNNRALYFWGPDSSAIKFERPLVIVAGTAGWSDQDCAKLTSWLVSWSQPVWLEATSNLRGRAELNPLLVPPLDLWLTAANFHQYFDSVIRVGGIPTTRLWRDLDLSLSNIPAIQISDVPFSGLARLSHVRPICAHDEIAAFTQMRFAKRTADFWDSQRALWRKFGNVGNDISWPLSCEEKALLTATQIIPPTARIFLGNSLPIRHWDKLVWRSFAAIEANRGANGIDGIVSTFLGWCDPDRESWLIVGDLSALYDLAGLWPMRRGGNWDSCRLRILVVNNAGGKIFKPIFANPCFINRHEIEFKNWAQQFGWEYRWSVDDLPEGPCVIELKVASDVGMS